LLVALHCDTSQEIDRAKEILERTGAKNFSSTCQSFAGLKSGASPAASRSAGQSQRMHRSRDIYKRRTDMFMILFLILLFAWIGGFVVFHVSSALIHVLLLFAVISLIMHFFQGRTTA
jgi:uncharacterized protein DUF5670